jgi:hypothetical protein
MRTLSKSCIPSVTRQAAAKHREISHLFSYCIPSVLCLLASWPRFSLPDSVLQLDALPSLPLLESSANHGYRIKPGRSSFLSLSLGGRPVRAPWPGSPRDGRDGKVLGNLGLTIPRDTTTRHTAYIPVARHKNRRSLFGGSRSGSGWPHFGESGVPLQMQTLYAGNRSFARTPRFEANPKCPGTRSTTTYNKSPAERF